ncbi:hypothetical protein RDWZM_002314 [Blomia tropicalis]|uniref:Pseudouridine synthase II N-terminal domain-containing protein n=1 Tax=Blomia tropicalis TaxID=40697 RepID=A0A9Q0MDM5_BLOTA|nr:hypothetical protein RDWZM_002314 [Blomia tropicalis]
MEINYAPTAFQLLRGCFCIYKPSLKGYAKTQLAIRQKLTQELNQMEVRPPRKFIQITGNLDSISKSNPLEVQVQTNLADHPLVCGPRYNEDHLQLKLIYNIGYFPSGIMIGLIGNEAKNYSKYNFRFPRIYEIKGEFGLATDNFRIDGKVRVKATFKHIVRESFERILAKIEAAQRSSMYKIAGVDLQSEEAYQFAKKGLIIPPGQTLPIIYAIRSVNFDLPNFTIQIQCYNENEHFLAELCNEIGLALKSVARCTGIRLIKYGPFGIDDALLEKHWTLENMIENIAHCNQIVDRLKLRSYSRRSSSS